MASSSLPFLTFSSHNKLSSGVGNYNFFIEKGKKGQNYQLPIACSLKLVQEEGLCYQKVWRLWEKGTEDKEDKGQPGCKEDEVESGKGKDEDVGGEDAKADWHRVDHGEGGACLTLHYG